MSKPFVRFTLPVCASILIAGNWWANAGDLNPPGGPISPTMLTLEDLSAQLGDLAGCRINRVVRGTVEFGALDRLASADLDPPIDPERSIVRLSAPVLSQLQNQSVALNERPLVESLTTNSITVRVAEINNVQFVTRYVAYEIVEYR